MAARLSVWLSVSPCWWPVGKMGRQARLTRPGVRRTDPAGESCPPCAVASPASPEGHSGCIGSCRPGVVETGGVAGRCHPTEACPSKPFRRGWMNLKRISVPQYPAQLERHQQPLFPAGECGSADRPMSAVNLRSHDAEGGRTAPSIPVSPAGDGLGSKVGRMFGIGSSRVGSGSPQVAADLLRHVDQLQAGIEQMRAGVDQMRARVKATLNHLTPHP